MPNDCRISKKTFIFKLRRCDQRRPIKLFILYLRYPFNDYGFFQFSYNHKFFIRGRADDAEDADDADDADDAEDMNTEERKR